MSVLRRRVVVTGLGLVTPLGVGVARVWKKLLDGESGIRKMESTDVLDYSSLPCQVATVHPMCRQYYDLIHNIIKRGF